MKNSLLSLISLGLLCHLGAAEKPNIIVVLCDDLGYGEIQSNAPTTSKILTPHADKLAEEGMRFTDAHSGSSVCTPTRYGLLTGRYSWRTHLQSFVLSGYGPCLIAEDRPTVASFLKDQGYHTALIGKWHLDFEYHDPKTGEKLLKKTHAKDGAPLGTKTPDGPIARGFDYFHGFQHARSMNVVLENDAVVAHDEPILMLPRLTKKAYDYIHSRKDEESPFFLYLPLNSPHAPVVPSPEWQGKSGLGPHGDFVMQTDHALGEVCRALQETGLEDNTLIIFTSDNGTSSAAAKVGDLKQLGHFPSGPLRGYKGSLWEGGHRVPFIVRWPAQIQAKSSCAETICLTDLFATTVEITKADLPAGSCEDSVSFLPALKGQPIDSTRKGIVHHSLGGHFSYRMGDWKLLLTSGAGGRVHREKVKPGRPLEPAQLYNMTQDLGEKNSLVKQEGEVYTRLLKQLEEDVSNGRSTAGPAATNDETEIILWKEKATNKAE